MNFMQKEDAAAFDIQALNSALDNLRRRNVTKPVVPDIVADDWFRHITPSQIIERAIQRLDVKGRGILLLHEIHPATALALPSLLKELKDRRYHIVHVVPPGELPNSVPALP